LAHRLTRITTRTGDDGTTGLADGSRLPKHSPRIEVLGALDELTCALGVLLAEDLPAEIASSLTAVQHDLFDFGGELAVPGRVAIQASHVTRLDQQIAALNASLPPLKEFILPGGARTAALAHLARATCRCAERRLTALAAAEAVNPLAVQYLNRLSDLLFVQARVLNRAAGRPDVCWQPDRNM